MDYWYPLVSLKFVEDIKMSEYNELKQATKEIEVLKSEIKTLKEQTNFVMNKLEKAIEDRIALRAENFKLKLASYEHTENNTETGTSNAVEKVDKGVDPLGRGQTYQAVPIDDTYPKYIQDNQDKFSHLIKPWK